ncbi:MAG: methylmalonyl-CoA mutase, partial [Candidatus Thorarchaeota archaeon]
MSDDKSKLKEIEAAKEKWEQDVLAPHEETHPEFRDEFLTTSSRPVARLYTPTDIPDFDYLKDLGFPSQFPYTRGVQPNMFRGKIWTMRQFAGMGSA